MGVCVWGGGGCVRVRVCRIYIHCLLLLENLCSIDHLVVFYILPQQYIQIWGIGAFSVTVLLVGIEVYASFDQVLDQTQADLLCDS